MTVPLPASISWPAIDAWLATHHPTLPQIDVDALARLLEGPPQARPLLLDARGAREYAVGHLPQARHAPRLDDALAVLAGCPADAAVVVYCSVGVRSARLAAALAAHGHTRVANLRGSIFAWANRGLPLSDATGPVRQVHPFDAVWGALLDPACRAPLE